MYVCVYIYIYIVLNNDLPVPVAARSKALVCGRSPAEIMGSNPTGAWMFVCFECCVLSGRGLCDGLITRPEDAYRLWRVVVCDQENLENEEAKALYPAVKNTTTMGCNARKTTRNNNDLLSQVYDLEL